MNRLFIIALLTIIFFQPSLFGSNNIFTKKFIFQNDDDFNFEEVKTKKRFSERIYIEFLNSVNVNYILGKDAKLINKNSNSIQGKNSLKPRIAYGFRYLNYVEINDWLDIGIGVGFDFRGYKEFNDSIRVVSVNGLNVNNAWVRTDYVPLIFSLKVRPTKWLYVRSGVDMNFLLIPYARVRKFDFYATDPAIEVLNRRNYNGIVPAFDFGLGFGANKIASFDLSLHYMPNIHKNLNFNYFMLRAGVCFKFNPVPGPSHAI